MRGASLLLLLWAYTSYIRHKQRTCFLVLIGFCILELVQTSMVWIQHAKAFPQGSFLRFHFLVMEGAKCEVGDFLGCAYLIVDAYLLPVVLILLAVCWYRRQGDEAVKH